MQDESHYYKFIIPKSMLPRKPRLAIGRNAAVKAIDWLVGQKTTTVHYDLETTGLQYCDPNQLITNIGLATADWLVGIDLTDVTFEEQKPLWDWLGQQKLGGFNLGFDLAWPWRTPTGDGRVNPNLGPLRVASDTALWFRALGTECHFLQKYNLETGVEKILLWPEEYQQKAWLKSALEKHQVKKADMWKLSLAEPTEYTAYCALDAEASLQLDLVFQETIEHWGFQGLRKYHDEVLVPKVKRNIEACCHGIPVDREELARNIEWCQRRMLSLEAKALEHPDLKPYQEEYIQRKLESNHELKYNMKKKWAKASDKPWLEPAKYRIAYVEDEEKRNKLPKWCREFGGKFYEPETQFTISKKSTEWPRFNVGSPGDMKWLIFDRWLNNDYKIWYRKPANPKAGGLVTIIRNGRTYEIALTKAGDLPSGGEVLQIFGEIGTILNEYKSLKKLLGDFLEKFYAASERTGYVHHQAKVLGAPATGRMSGGN